MESVPSKTFKAALVFKQSEISQLVRELRQLMQLTQVQRLLCIPRYQGATHDARTSRPQHH